ncbi:hypothetical protein [Psychrilyobacter atlanticus]|uniref:hypothetical protein n=1 Tax=Psychrilyobacter atlanticus TaxID=271091 RepID=UPI00040480D5|nr:hypothetical protein [Psychrilyobacter atlanticus]
MAVKKVTKKKKIEEPKEIKKESTFYIGPRVQRGILDKGTIFRGDLPEEVKKLKEKYPSIASLFVSEDQYVESLNEIDQPGTITNILFNKALEEVMK